MRKHAVVYQKRIKNLYTVCIANLSKTYLCPGDNWPGLYGTPTSQRYGNLNLKF